MAKTKKGKVTSFLCLTIQTKTRRQGQFLDSLSDAPSVTMSPLVILFLFSLTTISSGQRFVTSLAELEAALNSGSFVRPNQVNPLTDIASNFIQPNQPSSSSSQSYTCGQTKELFPVSRIVGGRRALPNEYPYQVALETERRSMWSSAATFRQFCGASVINDRWIVTAAHCLQRQNVNRLRGVIGTTNLRETNRSSVTFERMIIHEGYDSNSVRNDIGLLKTRQSIRAASKGNYVSPICLPRQGQQFSGQGVISGFGHVREGGPSSSLLLSSNLQIMPDTSCRASYGSEYSVPEMLCGGASGRDTCQGDSGGPFAQRTGNGWTLIGITSFGRGCARPGIPGVYTRVSNYVNWINNKMRNN